VRGEFQLLLAMLLHQPFYLHIRLAQLLITHQIVLLGDRELLKIPAAMACVETNWRDLL
jgi:hypothetical protein